jgi:hypothetical protein
VRVGRILRVDPDATPEGPTPYEQA